MAIKISTLTRNALANALKTFIDTGSGAGGSIKIYTSTQPASPQDSPSGTLLATLTLPNPSFGTASSGEIVANLIPSVNAITSGTAGWARILNCDGNTVMDGDVGTSGAFINLNSVSIVSGGPVIIDSGSFTMPE